MSTLTKVGLGDKLPLHVLFLLDPIDLDYETCLYGSRESTCSHS